VTIIDVYLAHKQMRAAGRMISKKPRLNGCRVWLNPICFIIQFAWVHALD